MLRGWTADLPPPNKKPSRLLGVDVERPHHKAQPYTAVEE